MVGSSIDKSRSFLGNSFSAGALFSDLGPHSQESIAKIKQMVRYGPDQIIFDAGDLPRLVYLLKNGRAELFLLADDERHPIRTMDPDEILGLTESLTGCPYEVGIRTVVPCDCECIEREDFVKLLEEDPEICFRLLKLLASNLQQSYIAFSTSIII